MKNPVVKILWLISGIILIFAGIIIMFNPAGTLETIAFVLSLALLISGVFSIVTFLTSHDKIFGAGWVLADGILDILIAAVLFLNTGVAASVLLCVFAMWALFTGISRIITSFDLKKLGISSWFWMLIAGIAITLLGFLSFIEPLAAAVTISIFIGLFFIVQGIISAVFWFYSQKINFDD